ncbi:hypothetical protein FRACA_1670010 [Frankia canadensis]|uniref:Uncharacterized protein n=1 Tax=Frankia canadensis TaxID=1836972 RepID=A0A2I2KMW6_9ACTN|nr:hypothetical protein [Frankia canadensis]SNQ47008.1 hypothetical protein FRACA_1670010 [Frankia canadensis]SOU54298.1 hypothetical protein FRACA_1670010 [Frankia canadensis]
MRFRVEGDTPPPILVEAAAAYSSRCCEGMLDLWRDAVGYWQATMTHDLGCPGWEPAAPRLRRGLAPAVGRGFAPAAGCGGASFAAAVPADDGGPPRVSDSMPAGNLPGFS